MKYLLTMILLMTSATSAFGQAVGGGTVRVFDGKTLSGPVQIRPYNPIPVVKWRKPKPKKKVSAPRPPQPSPSLKPIPVPTFAAPSYRLPTTRKEHIRQHIQSNPFYIPAEKNNQ